MLHSCSGFFRIEKKLKDPSRSFRLIFKGHQGSCIISHAQILMHPTVDDQTCTDHWLGKILKYLARILQDPLKDLLKPLFQVEHTKGLVTGTCCRDLLQGLVPAAGPTHGTQEGKSQQLVAGTGSVDSLILF